MPWIQELFSAPARERVLGQRRREEQAALPFFAGLKTGETDALVRSFAGEEPELHHPVRGRVKGARAFGAFVAETNEWLAERAVSIEDVAVVVTGGRSVEEVVLRLDGEDGGLVELPTAIVADRRPDGRLEELRVYFSTWPLRGRHAVRPPLLQPDPGAREADDIGEYRRALAAGDVDAILATFAPDGHVREPSGGRYVHRGADGLRAFYERVFSNGGGIPLELCATTDDGRSCALEYNVVRWGRSDVPPGAGVAVYERAEGGKLAAARVYDDSDPPL